jgi:hypothetical protein
VLSTENHGILYFSSHTETTIRRLDNVEASHSIRLKCGLTLLDGPGTDWCDPDFLRSNEATGQTCIFIDDITSMTPHALRYSSLSYHNNERTRPQFDERGVHIAKANINRISTPSNKDFIYFKSLFLLIYRRGRARDTPRKHHRLGV